MWRLLGLRVVIRGGAGAENSPEPNLEAFVGVPVGIWNGKSGVWGYSISPFEVAVWLQFAVTDAKRLLRFTWLGANVSEFPSITDARPSFRKWFLSPQMEQEQRYPMSERQLYYLPFPHWISSEGSV
jgi:hypothetical protein